jgi:hypothetical protein
MSSIIKVDQIQSDTGTVNLASNLAFSSAFSMSGPVTLNSPTIATPTMTGQAVIPSINLTSGQIVFPATQNPSAGANTLDDYEEGTWTPSVRGSSTAGTYTTAFVTATYTKVGRLVTARFDVSFSVASGGTGDLIVEGLPFSYKDNATLTGAGFAAQLNTTASSSNGICLVNNTGASATTLSLVLTRDNASLEVVVIGAVSTSTRLFFSFSYETP